MRSGDEEPWRSQYRGSEGECTTLRFAVVDNSRRAGNGVEGVACRKGGDRAPGFPPESNSGALQTGDEETAVSATDRMGRQGQRAGAFHLNMPLQSRLQWLPVLPIPVFFVVIGVLALLRIETVWNPPGLLPALNIVFLTIVSFAVSALAARSFQVEPSTAVLWLGCGTLALGLGSLGAGLGLGGSGENALVSVYNTAACLAGFCHFVSAVWSLSPGSQNVLRHRWIFLPVSYSIVFILVFLLVVFVRRGLWPVHFIEGLGGTDFGITVVWATGTAFALSSVLLGIGSWGYGFGFRRWYSLGLGLIAVGLLGVSLQVWIGDPLNWAGRTAQYLGGVYMGIAVILLIRRNDAWVLPIERALRESEERLHRFITSNPIGVFNWSAEKGIVAANERFLEMVGYSREDLSAGRMHWTDMTPGDACNRDGEALTELRATGRNAPYERNFVRKDGSLVPVLLSSVAMDTQRLEGIAFALDLSERKEAEAVLLRSRDELEMRVRERTAELLSANEALREQATLMDLAHDAIIVSNPAGGIVYWNEGAVKTYGWAKEEVAGQAMESILPVVDQGLWAVVRETLEKEGQWAGELSHVTKNGGEIVVASRQMLVRDEQERPRSVLMIDRDITARKQAEKKLRDHAAQLESLNAELQEFAFVASHDLQEPLRKIQAFGERIRLRHAGAMDDTGRDYLSRMERAAARMQGLLAALLDYSRVTTTGRQWELADLNEVLRGVVEDLEVTVHKCGGHVEIENLPVIEADSFQMRQLFQNLISNGLKYRRGSGQPSVRISSRMGGGKAEIKVEDNGIGFDEKYLDRIFKPFQRLHGHAHYTGTGMGLAICRKIVERHRGSITARSEPGKGSTFIVTLPVVQPGTRS